MDKFKLEYTNSRGETIELYGSPYKLITFLGLGDVVAETQTQRSPFLDGANYLDSILQPRTMDIQLKITANGHRELEENRSYLSRVFNPKLGLGTLRYISDTLTREIKCVATAVPSLPDGIENRTRTFQKAIVQLIAPNPYWRSIVAEEEELSSFIPLFEFTFEGEFEIGLEGSETIINNDSEVDAPIVISIQGPSLNPKITKTNTGEFIRVRRDVGVNDILIIDTENKTVELNGEDAFPYIDLSSTFFSLDVGQNNLKYEADVGNEDAVLKIIYSKLYAAI